MGIAQRRHGRLRTYGTAVLAVSAAAACGDVAANSPFVDAGMGGADAGEPANAAQDGPNPMTLADVRLPSPANFADVNVPVSFNAPVWLPAPSTNIEGDVADLVGSWVELNFDGTPCTPTHAGSDYEGVVCVHLDIQKADGGGVVGTVHGERSPLGSGGPVQVAGPFAPATNPKIGYPATVSPNDYFYAEQWCANVEYRMLDGVVSNGSLSFWFSPFDLWTDWCALQVPSAWDVGGATKYRCLSRAADTPATDLGKRALCTSASDGPTCTDATGVAEPCACFDDAGVVNVSLPLCVGPVCECSASECRANLRTSAITAMLELKSGKLAGNINFDSLAKDTFTFQKVSP